MAQLPFIPPATVTTDELCRVAFQLLPRTGLIQLLEVHSKKQLIKEFSSGDRLVISLVNSTAKCHQT